RRGPSRKPRCPRLHRAERAPPEVELPRSTAKRETDGSAMRRAAGGHPANQPEGAADAARGRHLANEPASAETAAEGPRTAVRQREALIVARASVWLRAGRVPEAGDLLEAGRAPAHAAALDIGCLVAVARLNSHVAEAPVGPGRGRQREREAMRG